MTSMSDRITVLETAVQNYNTQAEAILAAAGQGALDPDSIAAQIEAATQEAINEVLETVEGLDISELIDRTEVQALLTSLQNAYDPLNKFFFEMFTDLYTARDTLTVSGVSTVAGDDSVDVSDTSGLDVGQEYFLTDGTNNSFVLVDAILSSERFQANSDLSVTITDGTLNRSTVTIASNVATMEDGDVYYSVPINLDISSTTKKAVIVRTDSPDNITFYYKNTSSQVWTERAWGWKRDKADGYYDLEYLLTISSNFDIKIVASGTANIKHIVGMSNESGLEGTHHAPDTPTIVYPESGATDIGEQPSITTSAYSHPADDGFAGAMFQISTTSDFGDDDIIDESGLIAYSISYSPDADVLSESTTYYARAKHKDVYGGLSEWSAYVSFTTSSSFVTVDKPSITAPDAGAELGSPNGVTLTSSDFGTEGGTDTHAASQWQVSIVTTFATTVVDTGEDTTNLTSYDIADDTLERNTTYYCRVRHEGTAEGWSEWSDVVSFGIINFSPFVMTVGDDYTEYFHAIALDTSGNVYAVGVENSTTGGVYNAFIAKFDINGALDWQKNLGGSSYGDYFEDITVDDSGNIYAVGRERSYSSSDTGALISKFASDGSLTWQKAMDGAYGCYFYGVTTDSSGNIFAAGYEAISASGSFYNGFIVKFASDGTLTWQKSIATGGSYSCYLRGITTDSSGNVYVVGDEYLSSGLRAFIAKFASDGTLTWQKDIGGAAYNEKFYAITIDNSGNVYAVGDENSSSDAIRALIVKFASDGTLTWQKSIGVTTYLYDTHIRAITTDSSSNIYISGFEYASTSGANALALMVKLTSDGTLAWQKSLGGSSGDHFYTITEDGSGNIFVAGQDNSTDSSTQALLASLYSDATDATGTIPDITSLSFSDPSLSVSNPGFTLATTSLTSSTSSVSLSTSSLTLTTTSLTQILSEY